jgi:hypothetical protein
MAALPLLRPRPRGRVLGLRPVAVPAPARPAHVRVEAVRADRVHFSESWQPFRFLHYEHFCHWCFRNHNNNAICVTNNSVTMYWDLKPYTPSESNPRSSNDEATEMTIVPRRLGTFLKLSKFNRRTVMQPSPHTKVCTLMLALISLLPLIRCILTDHRANAFNLLEVKLSVKRKFSLSKCSYFRGFECRAFIYRYKHRWQNFLFSIVFLWVETSALQWEMFYSSKKLLLIMYVYM